MNTKCFENAKIIKNVCNDTLFIALPINVDKKNTENGICKCPHVRPATSNNGFGIYILIRLILLTLAANVTAINAFCFKNLNRIYFA